MLQFNKFNFTNQVWCYNVMSNLIGQIKQLVNLNSLLNQWKCLYNWILILAQACWKFYKITDTPVSQMNFVNCCDNRKYISILSGCWKWRIPALPGPWSWNSRVSNTRSAKWLSREHKSCCRKCRRHGPIKFNQKGVSRDFHVFILFTLEYTLLVEGIFQVTHTAEYQELYLGW